MPDPIPNTITTLLNQTLDIGSYITWECIDGYMMDGQTNTVVWVCLDDASWLGHKPICTAIKCPSPPIAAYSELDPSTEAPMVNQTISYTCSSSEYTLIGRNFNRCLQNGTWENDPPVCQRTCSTTNTVRYSNLTCYGAPADSGNWDDSFNLCENNKELLATVKDAQTQEFLVKILRIFNDNIWIGAREGRDWKWRKTDKFIERFFWQNPFPDSNPGDCIEFAYQSGSAKYSWNPRSFQEENALLCQYDQPCQSFGLTHSSIVLEYMGTCFQFLDVPMNCANGARECERRGGFLAEIIDESNNALLVDQALYLRNNNFVGEDTAWWIGGYDDNNNERSWYWSDQTRMIFETWQREQPSKNGDDCVEMRFQDGYQYEWNDRPCSEDKRTLCQMGIPACGDPGEPLHGNRLPDDRTTYSVGATLHFTCQEGYTLSGESVLRCMNNETWNHQRPSCEAVLCEGSPPEVALASIIILGSVYPDIAVYACEDGYIPDNEPISLCQHTGTWSTPNFTCSALSPCYSNPCMNGGTCYEVDGSSFTCTCTLSFTGSACDEEIMLTTPITFTTQASPQSTKSQTEMSLTTTAYLSTPLLTSSALTTWLSPKSTENPKGNSSPSGAIAAGSSVAILFILAVIIFTVILLRRRRAAKPVLSDDKNEMENYAAVANCYKDSIPADITPHAPYYFTVEADSDQSGGFRTSVAEQPSPQGDQPSVIKGSNCWNETDTEDGFVDNVLYGTSDEQTVRPSSLNHNSTDLKVAKNHAITTSLRSPGRPNPGNPKSSAPDTDEDVYESYEDEEIMVENELYNAPSPTIPRGHKLETVDDKGNDDVHENPDDNVYTEFTDDEILIDNELYGAPSPITPRAQKHGAVVDEGKDAVYENPDGNVYETYVEEDSMVDNELYGAATPPTSRADNTNDPVVGEGDGEMYQNTEFHSVPTNLIANELYKSVDEI